MDHALRRTAVLENHACAFSSRVRRGDAEWRPELEAIKADRRPPDFDNVILALERSGQSLDRVERAFFHLVGTASGDEIEAIQREIQPRLAREYSEMLLDDARSPASRPCMRGWPTSIPRRRGWSSGAGSRSSAPGRGSPPTLSRGSPKSLNGWRGSARGSAQNVLGDEKAYALMLEQAADLEGLPASSVAAAAATAEERGRPGGMGDHLVALLGRAVPAVLFPARPPREGLAAFDERGEDAASGQCAVMTETVALRAELAALLGYASYADFRLDDTMAKTPRAALDLLHSVWTPARAQARARPRRCRR